MNDIFNKLSKAADAFAEIITEGVRADSTVKMYRYEDFKKFFLAKKKEYPQVEKCTISVQVGKEFDDMFFSDNKYIIRMVMLDGENRPICVDGHKDEYAGGFAIADGIDKQLKAFMGEKTVKTVVLRGE